MISATPTKYRSRFDGKTIDSLLSSISNKIDISYIVNNFDGGIKLAASAETVKTLYGYNQRFSDPNYIKALILSIPNAVVVYQADMDKLYQLAGAFQGSYATTADRNTKVNTAGFKGGELTFIINSNNGSQELSYWDAGALAWVQSKFTPPTTTTPTTYPVGTASVISLDITKYNTAKYMIEAISASDIMVFEMIVTSKGSNTYWTTYGYVGSNTAFIKILNCVLTSTTLNINVQSIVGSTITITKISEM